MKKPFLLWVLIAVLTAIASFIALELGGFKLAYDYDSSRITFLIFAIFYIMTGWAGWITWKASMIIDGDVSGRGMALTSSLRNIKNDASHIETSAELCTLLGLLGTIAGIIMAFFGGSGFKGVQNNPNLGAAVGTAFITTGAGIISSIILVTQHHFLLHAVKRKQIELTPEAGSE